MSNSTVWEVYAKAIEKRNAAIKSIFSVPINTIAEELKIDEDLAEQCAIALQLLDIVKFDPERKEIVFTDNDKPADNQISEP